MAHLVCLRIITLDVIVGTWQRTDYTTKLINSTIISDIGGCARHRAVCTERFCAGDWQGQREITAHYLFSDGDHVAARVAGLPAVLFFQTDQDV